MIQQNFNFITEDTFEPEMHDEAAQLFTVTNGLITQNGCFEESNSVQTSKLTFVEGIESLDGAIHLPDWTSVVLRLNTEIVDLCTCEIIHYQRILDKITNTLTRTFRVKTLAGVTIEVETTRFLSAATLPLACIQFKLKSIDFHGNVNFLVVIDGQHNDSAELPFSPTWNVLQSRTKTDVAHLWIQTRKTNFHVCEAVSFDFFKNNSLKKVNATKIEKADVAGYAFGAELMTNESVTVVKYVGFSDSIRSNYKALTATATQLCSDAKTKGWEQLFEEHKIAMLAQNVR